MSNKYLDIAMEKVIKQEVNAVLDKIRAEILKCLSALDDIEKSGFNIYLPNEMSGRRLTYKQCLEFIDKYKADSEEYEEKRKQPSDDTRPYYANEWTP